jgi:serine/threonine protein kinase
MGVPANADARRFGKYTLVAKLATGGMAEIFLARLAGDGGFEKLVCIKRILPHLAKDPQFVAMFLDEARVAARISHPNVCQVFELGEIEAATTSRWSTSRACRSLASGATTTTARCRIRGWSPASRCRRAKACITRIS